jgi:[ribosomal protein S5]-alanine N-acetyltransferase
MSPIEKGEEIMENKCLVESKNLCLRYFNMDDVVPVFEMSQEEGMKQWIPDQVYADEQEAKEVIEFLMGQYSDKPNPKVGPFVLGVALKDSGELIGHVGLSPARNNVEIGYAIADKHQGKGYGTEVVSTMSKWALENIDIPCILGIVASENLGSCRVLEKSGYELMEEKHTHAFGRECLCRTYRMDSK